MTAKEALEIIVDLTTTAAAAPEERFEQTRNAVLTDIETLAISYDDMDFEVEHHRTAPSGRWWNPDWYGEPFGVVEVPSRRKPNKNNNLDLTSI